MALKVITRLKPCDLQEVQVQSNVTVDGLLTAVIQTLQFNYNVIQTTSPLNKPLNTHCPTCAVEGDAKGFLKHTVDGKDIYAPCPTCKGYLLYYTADGVVTPPTNPFAAPITVKRLLPADLKQALTGFPASTKLSGMIVSLQGNVDTVPTNACPECANGAGGISTGWEIIQSVKIICSLCGGVQKTVALYEMVSGVPKLVIPVIVLPDPLLVPDIPDGAVLHRL